MNDPAKIPVKGNLKIEAVYADGKIETLVDDKNLVVSQAETIMPQMAVGLRSFSYIELGDASPVTPPAMDNISLEATTGERKVVSNAISGNTISLEAIWALAEGNGYSFTEAGLFTIPFGAGLLFARKTFPAITKTAAFALKFTWTIAFFIEVGSNSPFGVQLIGQSAITTDYLYTAIGGEATIVVPIDFVIGNKSLDVSLNGQVLAYGDAYFETSIGALKGISFIGFTLLAGDKVYVKQIKLS